VPAVVGGDPGRLRQILLNLVSNAVKFTEQGWVGLTLRHKPVPDGVLPEEGLDRRRVRLLFSVADSGIGIDPQAIDRMFQEFTQMDGSISRQFGGSGLGLAICRRLVELMGGTITVESQPGNGSNFSFDVMLNPGKAAPPADPLVSAEPLPGPGIRVLVAEDDPTNRVVALRMLERLGHHADIARNGIEAIAALEHARYDVILMDVMMPEMDGVTATRAIRAAEADGGRIAIVGLTAGSGPDNLAACMEAGMDAVTTKPITLTRLRAALAEGLGTAGRHCAETAPETTTSRLRDLVEMLGEEAVAEIVRTFAEDTQATLATMRRAAATKDTQTTHRSAHSVAGAARNVGADALAMRALMLEQTVGSLSAMQIGTEVAAMQADLDAILDGFKITFGLGV
jgi:CheY-like chemotaxis protein/HPt (histidine-containing phosphotransfer) domain-containing protein